MPDVESQVILPSVRFRILGPLQVLDGGHSLALGSRKQQVVLAALLAHANNPVSVDSLAEALWMDRPPRTARKNIQVYVSELRSLVSRASGSSDSDQSAAGARISYQAGGYVFHASAA
jgi:DNA-binding SARP family transcriptional activator